MDLRGVERAGLRLTIYGGYPATIGGLVWSVGHQDWYWAAGWGIAVAGVVGAALAILPITATTPEPLRPSPGMDTSITYAKASPATAAALPPPAVRRRSYDDD